VNRRGVDKLLQDKVSLGAGGVLQLQPDTNANHDVYAATATEREIILETGTTTPPAAAAFMRTLRGGAAR
jgi:lipid-binding SYLF domain-containing protein